MKLDVERITQKAKEIANRDLELAFPETRRQSQAARIWWDRRYWAELSAMMGWDRRQPK